MKHRYLCILVIASIIQRFVIDAWVKGVFSHKPNRYLFTFSSISPKTSPLPRSYGHDISPPSVRSEKKFSPLEQGAEIRKLLQTSENRWMIATIQSISPFGLFVRPAGSSIVGKNI